MRLQSKTFRFTLPFTERRKINGAIKTIHLFDMEVEGTAYFDRTVSLLEEGRYKVDIDFLTIDGQRWTMSVLETIGANVDDIYTAAEEHASGLFSNNSIAA